MERARIKGRGPLPFIILSATGEDVRHCANCWACESLLTPEMDLTFGEVMQAVARDDERALTNRTLWACDGALASNPRCQEGIDIPAVIHALRQEAELRGYSPHPQSGESSYR